MFITDTYGAGSDVSELYCELNSILTRYRRDLQACNVGRDIEMLKWAIEKSLSGSTAATYYLVNHGSRVLTLIREKISLYQQGNRFSA